MYVYKYVLTMYKFICVCMYVCMNELYVLVMYVCMYLCDVFCFLCAKIQCSCRAGLPGPIVSEQAREQH